MWLTPRAAGLPTLVGGRAYIVVPQGIGGRWARGTYADDLTRELELTPAQRSSIDSIVLAQQDRVTELTREIEPRFRAIAQETRRQIESALTGTQRAKFEAMRGTGGGNREGQGRRDAAP
jgi:Spy/CpxP family protein refolding chaperone